MSRREYPAHAEADISPDDDYELNCITTQESSDISEYYLEYEPMTEPLPTISELTVPKPVDQLPDISMKQINDTQLRPIIDYLTSGVLPEDDKAARRLILESQDFIVANETLYHLYYPRGKGHKSDRLIRQLVVPQILPHDVLLSYHDSVTGGHQGMERTYQSIRQKYFWPECFLKLNRM